MEEHENDLHPQALKALLDLIIESSNSTSVRNGRAHQTEEGRMIEKLEVGEMRLVPIDRIDVLNVLAALSNEQGDPLAGRDPDETR